MIDWFTGLSDGLQVAFVSFLFTIMSSLTTVWLTNRHTWKLERDRWKNDRERDEDAYLRNQREMVFQDQRRGYEAIARGCAEFSTQIAVLVGDRDRISQQISMGEENGHNYIDSFLNSISKLNADLGLCDDPELSYLMGEFLSIAHTIVERAVKPTECNSLSTLSHSLASANGTVQQRARNLLFTIDGERQNAMYALIGEMLKEMKSKGLSTDDVVNRRRAESTST